MCGIFETCKFMAYLSGAERQRMKEICRIHGVNDPNKIKELKREKAFGNLMNKIYLYKMINGGF